MIDAMIMDVEDDVMMINLQEDVNAQEDANRMMMDLQEDVNAQEDVNGMMMMDLE